MASFGSEVTGTAQTALVASGMQRVGAAASSQSHRSRIAVARTSDIGT